MAYQIKRLSKINETLELVGDDNTVAHTLVVSFTVDDLARDINKAKNDVIRAQQAIKNVTDEKFADAQETMGDAIISLFSLIFGEEQTKTLIEFYKNAYTEMFAAVFPFLDSCIFPAIAAATRERCEMLANNFKLSKSTKKKLML